MRAVSRTGYAAAAALSALCLAGSRADDAAPELPGGRIAFLRPAELFWQVWIVDAGGGEAAQLTTSPLDKIHLDWRPGTTELLYQTSRGEVFALEVETREERRILEGLSSRMPRWSPDGRWLLYETSDPGTGKTALWRSRPEGTAAEKLCEDASPGASAVYVSAKTILHTTVAREADWGLRHDFRLVSLAAAGEHRTFEDDEPLKFDPAAGPGETLAYASLRSGFYEIWTSADSGPRQLTRLQGSAGNPTWSPEGKAIAFDFERDGTMGIYGMRLDGGDPVPVTEGPIPSRRPVWIPGSPRQDRKEAAP